MKRYFIDTNVVLDLLTARKGFYQDAKTLFDITERGHAKLHVCALSFSNIFYVLRKWSSREQRLAILTQLSTLVDIAPVNTQVIHDALSSDFVDLEDAIQTFSAIQIDNIDAIVTRNTKDFIHSPIPILSPAETVSMAKL